MQLYSDHSTFCTSVLRDGICAALPPRAQVKHERELWKEVVERRQQQPLQLALCA